MVEKRLVVSMADGPMTTLVWHPDGEGPFPVVVCFHDGPGLREVIYETARRVAAEGYYTAVPDLYHRRGEMISFDMAALAKGPGSPEAERLLQTIVATTPPMMSADTAALVDALEDEPRADTGRCGCIGFCHTARAVIQVMADMPDRFVVGSFLHPGQTVTDGPDSPHLQVERISGQIYAGFGGADLVAPVAGQQPLIDELEKLGSNAVVEIYERGGHGFLWPGSPAYDSEASSAAWAWTVTLFERNLGAPANV